MWWVQLARTALAGSGLALLLAASAGAADPPTEPGTTGRGAKRHAAPVSPRLESQSPINAIPEALHNPTDRRAPTRIHQRDWGVFNRDGGAPAGFGPVARYGVDRSAEDWQELRDPSHRADRWDPFKFIPLNTEKSIYLTLSFEQRVKTWYETDPFLGQQKPTDSARVTARSLAGADLHLGPWFRVYAELVHGDAGGWRTYGYTQAWRKTLDLQQAFAEATVPVGSAKVGVIAGRQEFFDAPNSVIYGSETPNLPLSWNGIRAYAVWPRFRVDAFDLVQTNVTPSGVFGDIPNVEARLSGAYASWALPDFTFALGPGHVFLDAFYFGYHVAGSAAAVAAPRGSVSGTTHRDNFGTRLWGKAGPVDFSFGGIWQGGWFQPGGAAVVRPVSAYAVNMLVGIHAGDLPADPLLAIQADLYSGGHYFNDHGAVGSYLAPFSPQTGYLDTTSYLAPGNLIDVAPLVQLAPDPDLVAKLKLPWFWRASTDDAIFGAGRIYGLRPDRNYVGVVPQLDLAWRATRHLTWTGDFGDFLASDALHRAGARDGLYFLSTFDWRL